MDIPYDKLNPVPKTLAERIDNDFTYHPPRAEDVPKFEKLRAAARAYAELIVELCPVSREQNLALTNLDQTVFWSNSAIVRNPS